MYKHFGLSHSSPLQTRSDFFLAAAILLVAHSHSDGVCCAGTSSNCTTSLPCSIGSWVGGSGFGL